MDYGNVKKTKKMLLLEEASGQDIKELLSDLNIRMTQLEICNYLKNTYGISVSQGPLSQWFFRLGIPARAFRLPADYERVANE